jgi:hypothetical protein
MNVKNDNAIERLGKKIERDVDLIKKDFHEQLKLRKKREEKVNFIAAFLKEMGGNSDSWVNLGCRMCRTSFDSNQYFTLPTRTDTMKWSLIWETPKSVEKRKDLKKLLDKYHKQLTSYNFSEIVSWSYDDVQTCMVLICHAFHCPGVQCYFIQGMDTWGKEDREKLAKKEEQHKAKQSNGYDTEDQPIEPVVWGGSVPKEELRTLPKSINTLLLICHKEYHFGVMKILPDQHVVQVWDAAVECKEEVEEYWKIHAIRAIKVHFLDQVQEDEFNILTTTEVTAIKERNNGNLTPFVKDNMPTWIVEGMWSPDSYHQEDSHSCGPIALNRFASELHTIYSELEMEVYLGNVDAAILNRIKTPEQLADNNCKNAAELYQVLLATKRDAFKTEEGGEEDAINNKFVMKTPTIIEIDDDESSEKKSGSK